MDFSTDYLELLEIRFGDTFSYAHHGGEDAEKIQRAEAAYAPARKEDGEELLLVYDATFFGSADEGVALSTKNVYFKRSRSGVHLVFGYDEIVQVAACSSGIILMKKGSLEPITLRLPIATEEEVEDICAAIEMIKGTLKERMKEATVSSKHGTVARNTTMCPSCGAKLMPNAKFCSMCGCPIER